MIGFGDNVICLAHVYPDFVSTVQLISVIALQHEIFAKIFGSLLLAKHKCRFGWRCAALHCYLLLLTSVFTFLSFVCYAIFDWFLIGRRWFGVGRHTFPSPHFTCCVEHDVPNDLQLSARCVK